MAAPQDALPGTAVSYLYVSEHHFVGRLALKTAMRDRIRANRLCGPAQMCSGSHVSVCMRMKGLTDHLRRPALPCSCPVQSRSFHVEHAGCDGHQTLKPVWQHPFCVCHQDAARILEQACSLASQQAILVAGGRRRATPR